MEVMQALTQRRSCRGYKPDPVPEDVLAEILKAGTYAPTAMGKQSPIILCVTNKELRDRLSRINASFTPNPNGDPFYGAPVVLVVLADKAVAPHVYDGSLVMGNLMNAAWDQGVNSCWIHRAKETFESEEGKAILKELGIEGDYEGIGNCILGYAAGPESFRAPAPRKENYVYYIK